MQDLSDYLGNVEEILESLDNAHGRNNIKLRGLKEGVEGENLSVCLMELLTA